MSTVKRTNEQVRAGKGRVDRARIAQFSDAEREAMRIASGVDDASLSPPQRIVPEPNVRTLRERLGLSQTEFARRFGLSSRTVQQWEQRRSVPEGPARVLLRLIDDDPDRVARSVSGLPDAPPHQPKVSFARGFPIGDESIERDSDGAVPFIEHIVAPDDTFAILVGHAYLELLAARLLQQHMPDPDAFAFPSRLPFTESVDLALALAALDRSIAAALKELNSVRNRLTHRFDTPLPEQVIRSLISRVSKSVGTDALARAEAIVRETSQRLGGRPQLTSEQVGLRAAIAVLWLHLSRTARPC